MFQDDSWEDDFTSEAITELLEFYKELKVGKMSRFLEEEDYEYIIEYYFRSNNEKEALQACQIAEQYFPYSPTLLLLKAEGFYRIEDYDQALQALDKIDELTNNVLDAVLWRSDIYLAQLRNQKAIDCLKEAIPHFEKDDKIILLLELADVYDEDENDKAVFYTFKKVLELEPENIEALHQISFWADFTGLQQESKQLHQKIIDETPFNTEAWFNLAAAHQGLREYEEAIDSYEYCIALDEKFEAAYRNMADSYIKIEQYDKAILSLKKNLALGSPEDVIYEAMGHCFEQQKDFPNARQSYLKAVHLNPADDAVFFRIGETYTKEGNYKKAANSYSKALTLNKSNADCLKSLGDCLIELEDNIQAISCYMSAISLKPNNIKNWVALLKGLYLSGCYEEMAEDVETARDVIGDRPEFDFLKALVLFELGKTKEAKIQLETGLTEAPKKIKLILDLKPELLHRKDVSQLISHYKRKI